MDPDESTLLGVFAESTLAFLALLRLSDETDMFLTSGSPSSPSADLFLRSGTSEVDSARARPLRRRRTTALERVLSPLHTSEEEEPTISGVGGSGVEGDRVGGGAAFGREVDDGRGLRGGDGGGEGEDEDEDVWR